MYNILKVFRKVIIGKLKYLEIYMEVLESNVWKYLELYGSTWKYTEIHGSTHGWKSGVQKID